MSNIYDVNTTKCTNSKVESFYEKAMKELIDFYGVDWVDNTPIIYLVNSRKNFDLIYGHKTEDWVVGTTLGYNTLLLFSPESYEKYSRHKYSDEEYYSLIKHELSHLFYTIFSKGNGPEWLDEGFAIYLSKQLKEKPNRFKNFLKYYSHTDDGIYKESGFVVDGLIKKYGKGKVVDFLKVLPNINSEGDFKKKFEKYFDLKLEYAELQCLL